MNDFDEQAARRDLGPAVIDSFEALQRKVRRAAGDDWHSIQAIDLRSAVGSDKLGTRVRDKIGRACAVVGLEIDGAIPDRQDHWVRVRAVARPEPTVPGSDRDDLVAEINRLREALYALSDGLDNVERLALRGPGSAAA